MAEPPSSPPSGDASAEDSLAWYKNQYEQLAVELAEFRESSGELEAELEKDLEAADKRERQLRERAEGLQFEVDEWKVRDMPRHNSPPSTHRLTARALRIGEMQKGQGRGEHGPDQSGKGDYDPPRHQPDHAAQAARH
jgi:hypothetical protein